MPFNESVVRKNLAKILDMLEEGMTLIKEEFHLPNKHGTSGFIDIFARDKDGKLVVIEVKISKQAERDAITELFKYITLLKQKMSIKDSEIRLIVISTDWRELLTPFSEFHWNTNYNSQGFIATVDSTGSPIELKPVQLLSKHTGRRIIPRHWIQTYESKVARDIGAVSYGTQIEGLGIKNFVIALFNYNYPQYGISGYGFYFGQQEENLQLYKGILKSHNRERYKEISSYTKTLSEPEDILNEFADAATEMVDVPADEMEIGHPEKIKAYLQNDSWQIEKIERYGSFSQDIRLQDQDIISDLCGYTGGSHVWFSATVRATDKSHLNEVKQNYPNCLFHNDDWRTSIRDLLDYFDTKPETATLHLNIFNPENILETISLLLKKQDTKYLPNFFLAIENEKDKELEIFHGTIEPTHQPKLKPQEIASKYFDGSFSNAVMQSFFHEMAPINSSIMGELGLKYSVSYIKFRNGEEEERGANPKVRGTRITHSSSQLEGDLLSWLSAHPKMASKIADEYMSAIITPSGSTALW